MPEHSHGTTLRPRFIVSTVEGNLTDGVRWAPGLSAIVLDTADCHRRVAEFQSEGYRTGYKHVGLYNRRTSNRIGKAGAVAMAEALAADLNERYP